MDEIIPKYSEWLTNFTFDNCAVGRKAYGEFLASYLVEEKDGFVLNLNGKWGTGKTEFLKRMYSHLHAQNHPVIYIDAWESDFTENPLLVVASELLAQLKTLLPVKGDDIDKLTVYLGKFFKGTAIVAGSFIGEKLIQDGAAGREFVKSFMESSPEDLLDTMRKGYSEQVVKNAQAMAERLTEHGYSILSGGTDNHLMLVDLRPSGMDGAIASDALDKVGITINKNSIPFDTASPFKPSGIRLGTPAVTTRGMKEDDIRKVSDFIHAALENRADDAKLAEIREEVFAFNRAFPLPR